MESQYAMSSSKYSNIHPIYQSIKTLIPQHRVGLHKPKCYSMLSTTKILPIHSLQSSVIPYNQIKCHCLCKPKFSISFLTPSNHVIFSLPLLLVRSPWSQTLYSSHRCILRCLSYMPKPTQPVFPYFVPNVRNYTTLLTMIPMPITDWKWRGSDSLLVS